MFGLVRVYSVPIRVCAILFYFEYTHHFNQINVSSVQVYSDSDLSRITSFQEWIGSFSSSQSVWVNFARFTSIPCNVAKITSCCLELLSVQARCNLAKNKVGVAGIGFKKWDFLQKLIKPLMFLYQSLFHILAKGILNIRKKGKKKKQTEHKGHRTNSFSSNFKIE